MNKQERIKAARERANEASAALVKYDKDKAEADAKAKVAAAKMAAFQKRSPTIMLNVANSITQTTLGALRTETGYGSAPMTPKQIREGLEANGIKVGATNGINYSVRGLVPRIRIPSKASLAAIKRAERRYFAALEVQRKAHGEFLLAQRLAFDTGEMLPVEAVIDSLVKRASLPKGNASLYAYGWERDRIVKAAEQANLHLSATLEGADCTCAKCAAERSDLERRKALEDKRAALPKQLVKCADHGSKRMPVEWAERNIPREKADEWGLVHHGVLTLPIAWCPVGEPQGMYPGGHPIVLVTQYKAEIAKAEKERAKAAKVLAAAEKAAKRAKKPADLPEVEEGDLIDFTCPHCDEVHVGTEVYAVEDPEGETEPRLYVECEECEDTALVDHLTTYVLTKITGGKAA